MNGLIAIAVFFWFMATLSAYVFTTDLREPFLRRFVHSIRLDFRRSAGLKVIPSIFQATSIYWIGLGVIINWVGETWFKGFLGDIVIVALIGAPLLIAAIIAQKRKDKSL